VSVAWMMGRDRARLASFWTDRVASVQDVVRVAGCELVRMRLPMAWCKIRRLTAGIPQRISCRFQGIGLTPSSSASSAEDCQLCRHARRQAPR
jgi:hypothetical protein